MPIPRFDRVQAAVLAGASVQEVLALLPPGSRLETRQACPTCHAGYVARVPATGERLICLACGLEFVH